MRRLLIGLLLAFGLVCATHAQPAKPEPDPVDPLLADAEQAIASHALVEFAASVESRIKPLLSDLEETDLAHLTNLAGWREMARFCARIEQPEESTAQTMQWLIRHPRVMQRLMLAVSDADAPDRVLTVLGALRTAYDAQLEQYPDLTAAMCVVWDTPARFDDDNPSPEVDRAVWLFKYLTTGRDRLRFDLTRMPTELAAYVVDNAGSQEDVAWATKQYSRRGAIGSAYFDVRYDTSAYFGAAGKAVGAHEYTLANLARYGGVCSDQAYFATTVAQSLGVPACICVGLGGASETAHAWVGYLDTRGRTIAWNFSEGRYAEHLYWKANVQDPQTRAMITDSDVGLLAEAARTNERDRLASRALCKVADLADPHAVFALYRRAIELSPGNREAWMQLAQLGAELRLSDAQLAAMTQVIANFAAKSYPDFALEILQKLHSGRGTQQRMQVLKQAREMFKRPDLVASIRLAEGDLLRDQQRPSAALAAFGEVLTQYHNAGPITLAALQRIETLLRENNELRRLAAIYAQAWQRLPVPTASAYARSTPYCLVGQKYVTVLEELGESAEARRVRSRLNSVTGTRAAP